MPLITSPIDGSPMTEITRYGVKIDICPTSGGIWLDKGELEKIIMMIREEALEDGRGHSAPREQRYADDYDDRPRRQSSDGYSDHRRPRRKGGGIFDNLMDIFD
ncbi:MAG: zf-TFIIB domain-containing protein [Pseudomonadota bacterium]